MDHRIHHPRRYSSDGTDFSKVPEREREIMWNSAVEIMELTSWCYTNEALQRFNWHTKIHFPWYAFLFLLADLRIRTEGDECERGWYQVDMVYRNHPEYLNGKVRRPLYYALGNLCLKAWNAREYTMASKGQPITKTPEYIFAIRETQARRRHPQDAIAEKAGIDLNVGLVGSGIPAILPRQTPVHTSTVNPQLSDLPSEADPTLADTFMEDLGPVDWAQWDSLLQDFEVPE